MIGPITVALFVALKFLLILTAGGLPVEAVSSSFPNSTSTNSSSGSDYWLANIKRQGISAFNPNGSDYNVFRNVKDYGAKGDGTTDDTDALNNAISIGSRCAGMQNGCNSSTITPALVYFPPGTYLVSKPIVQYYYTQFVGDAVTLPTIKAAANFTGLAVMGADPYDTNGVNWYSNRDNFHRQIRNLVIDLTAMNPYSGTGIHWQVAQATSLQNIRFEMVKGPGKNGTNNQQGIFMENGSGGFMTDLTFNGGKFGAWMGSQQFTTRNLTFNDCQTAVYLNYNWVWTFKSIFVNNCGIGIDMAQGGLSQTVGSVLVLDSKFTDTPIGISTAFSKNQTVTNGTLVLDNVDFSGCKAGISNPLTNRTILPGIKVGSWAQGEQYIGSNHANDTARGKPVHGDLGHTSSKPAKLLNAQGAVFERAKPQYEECPVSAFISVKLYGAKGDGVTDDTEAIQKVLDSATQDQIVYFDHGAYVVSKTIKVPQNIRITGEIWPMIMASGTMFQNIDAPVPVFQVGQPGDTGCVEMSDLIFTTIGPQPGAILVQWNVAEPYGAQGTSGMWDVHFRIGGAAGTQLQSDTCANHNTTAPPISPKCEAAFLLLHVTPTGSIYLENNWFWVADHDLDTPGNLDLNIFNGRGVLIESAEGPVWMYGTSSEHSQLYNYHILNSKNVYAALLQTETPYMQSNPSALDQPFKPINEPWTDPTFEHCTRTSCLKSTGLRIVNSSEVYVYGTGLYSFFDNYNQDCLSTESCQEDMVALKFVSNVSLFGLSTKGSTNMVTTKYHGVVPQKGLESTFCSTLARFLFI
ncbi:MAG: hypothetical protein M1812_007520 [Candelaria pacifica]|nr:MAG: hypothetical protein M1812_007520 [Candelaria pacifica]